MQLLLRTSRSSFAKLLLIFFWCEIASIQVLVCSSCSTRGTFDLHLSTVSGELLNFGNNVAGGSGLITLVIAVLCMNFKDTNSLSLPRRRKLKKLHSLFKQGSVKRRQANDSLGGIRQGKGKQGKKKKAKKKKDRRIKYSGGSEGSYDDEDYLDDYDKSKRNHFLSHKKSSQSVAKKSDRVENSSKFRNGVNPALYKIYRNLLSIEKPSSVATPSFFHSSTKPKDKRKLDRQGKNANEPASASSERTSNSFIGGLFMNKNEEEALRLKILAKVEELDPLMCIPKVLCGYSSRQRQRKNGTRRKPMSTTTTTTKRPFYLDEHLIDEYLQLLKIVPVDDKKKNGREKNEIGKNRSEYDSEEYDDGNDENDELGKQQKSSSSSSESNESVRYEPYPVRKPLWNRDRERDRQNKLKWLFNRNKNKDEDDDDDDDDDDAPDNDEDEAEDDLEDDDMDDLIDDDDMKYLVERAKMEKLMATSGSNSNENWWSAFEEPKPSYYPYPIGPDYDPLKTDDVGNGGFTGWISNMFSSFMPRISWAGALGGSKDDDFKSDPFFTSFDGRSLKTSGFGEESQSYFAGIPSATTTVPSHVIKNRLWNVPTFPLALKESKLKNGRMLDLEKLLREQINHRQSYINGGTGKDPAEKYRVAVEFGKRLTDPSQCDFIYNGCPLSYAEILVIINEPMKEALSTSASSSTTTTKKPKTSNPVTKRISTRPAYELAHNLITIPSSPTHLMVMPVHQQQYNPYHQQGPYHHHFMPNQPNYNQQFQHEQQQQQLQYLQQNLHPQDQEFLQHQYHIIHPAAPSTGSLDELTSHWGKKSTGKPHKTRIHQDLPSGELEINLLYSDKKAKTGLERDEGNVEASEYQNDSEYTEAAEGEKGAATLLPPSSASSSAASSSASVGIEDPMQTQSLSDPFNRKNLGSKIFEQPVPSQSYKIWKKDAENGTDVDKEKGLVVDTLNKEIVKRKFKVESKSEEWNNMQADVNRSPGAKPENPIRASDIFISEQGPHEIHENVKGKYDKNTVKAPATSPLISFMSPLHHSSAFNVIQPESSESDEKRRRKRKRNRNDNMMISSKNKKKKKKGIMEKQQRENDNNDSSNGSTGSFSSTSNEYEAQLKKHYKDHEYRNDQKRKKRKHNKTHLHKQSSESSEVEKGVVIPAASVGSNAIYSLHRHPFPPPYATYYTPTPTSPSFFSYFFGR